MGPEFTFLPSLPFTVLGSDWSLDDIRLAVQSHDIGSFYLSGHLLDGMVTDDSLSAVMDKRTLGLLARRAVLKASSDSDVAREARDLSVEHGDSFLSAGAVNALLLQGVMIGVGIAQVRWEEVRGYWCPSLEVWHPSWIRWRQDVRAYEVQTCEGPTVVDPGNGQWVVFTPYGEFRGWLRAAVRSLALTWRAHKFAMRDWLRWSETYSQGIKKAMAPADASDDKKEQFFRQVSQLGSETTVLLEKNFDGTQFDLDVLFPASGPNADGFEKLMSKCESRFAIRLLGNNLSTEVKSGSFAATQVHFGAEQNVLEADARAMAACIRRDLLEPWALFNFGARELAPRLSWEVDLPDDPTAFANSLAAFANAANSIRGLPIPIDWGKLGERFGIPMAPPPAVGPEADPPAPAPAPAPAAPAMDGDAAALDS